MKGLFAVASLAVFTTANARTFTVRNNCGSTIWPAIFTPSGSSPDHATGWEAASGTQETFNVPNDWTSGRIWGRTNCDFSRPGADSCETGGCEGGLECTATGRPPASLAEWTLQGDGNQDFYDVSLVDGFNLPMAITNNVGCPVADCPANLNSGCPGELSVPGGCNSACSANLDGNPEDSANCCSGSHNTPETCPVDGVQFYDYFKDGCPNSYAYAYDEPSGALKQCDSGLAADYTLTFCP
ncbi:hypothetical protein VNI00_011168 [Paramarasmius palmivorus]|uniref:Thaumatin-like protein n=1 Tax=Paramarasmius palmivorus TaxID=297713 RepID=A0AAW0CHM0_9AGAR